MIIRLEDIIDTLNHVEVRGKDNLDRMLGAILGLEFILKEASVPPVEERREEPQETEVPIYAEDTTEGG